MLIYNIVSVLHSVLDNHYATGKIMTGWHNWVKYGIFRLCFRLAVRSFNFSEKIPKESGKMVSIRYAKGTCL